MDDAIKLAEAGGPHVLEAQETAVRYLEAQSHRIVGNPADGQTRAKVRAAMKNLILENRNPISVSGSQGVLQVGGAGAGPGYDRDARRKRGSGSPRDYLALLTIAPDSLEKWIRQSKHDREFQQTLFGEVFCASIDPKVADRAKALAEVVRQQVVDPTNSDGIDSVAKALAALRATDKTGRMNATRYLKANPPSAAADIASVHDALKAIAMDEKSPNHDQAADLFIGYATAADSADLVTMAVRDGQPTQDCERAVKVLFRADPKTARQLVLKHMREFLFRCHAECAMETMGAFVRKGALAAAVVWVDGLYAGHDPHAGEDRHGAEHRADRSGVR